MAIQRRGEPVTADPAVRMSTYRNLGENIARFHFRMGALM